MRYFAKNLSALEKREPELVSRLKSVPDNPGIRAVENGIEVSFFGGKSVLFEKREIPPDVKRISDKKLFRFSEVIILLGAGLGEVLAETLKTSDRTAFILLIEADAAFFKKLIEVYDLSKELADPRVSVAVGENPVDAVMGRLEREFSVFTRYNFQVIKNGLSLQCNPDYYREIDRMLEKQKAMAEGNLLSISMLSGVWQKNILTNLPLILESPGIRHVFGKMRGIPALLAAAGPSLDKNCRWIKMAESSMVIICVDTALKTLVKNGVRPHFVVSLDSLLENWAHIEGEDASKYTLVVNPVTYPLILSEHGGDVMVTSYSEPLVRWLEQFTGDLGLNLTGGSVATSAFDFANRMGCSPIILTGQDLAFTGGRTHASGGSKEETLYTSMGAPSTVSTHHEEAIYKELGPDVTGNLGHILSTSEKMNTWKNWFEIQIENRSIECLNATEGGARIMGAKAVTLPEALASHGKNKRDILGIIRSSRPSKTPSNITVINQRLKNLAESAREIKKICSFGIKEAQSARGLSQKKGQETTAEKKLKTCSDFVQMIMKETDFLEINHWRLENTMDKLQRIQSSIKSSERRAQLFLNSETLLIFFREMYKITRELERNIRKTTAGAKLESDTERSAYVN